MITGLAWLLGFQLVGEVLVRVTGLPLPGPVVGMLLLFVALQLRQPVSHAPVLRAANALLRHMQLFFVPAGVGVIAYLAVLRAQAAPILVAMTASWAVGLLTVAWVTVLLRRGGADGRGADG